MKNLNELFKLIFISLVLFAGIHPLSMAQNQFEKAVFSEQEGSYLLSLNFKKPFIKEPSILKNKNIIEITAHNIPGIKNKDTNFKIEDGKKIIFYHYKYKKDKAKLKVIFPLEQYLRNNLMDIIIHRKSIEIRFSKLKSTAPQNVSIDEEAKYLKKFLNEKYIKDKNVKREIQTKKESIEKKNKPGVKIRPSEIGIVKEVESLKEKVDPPIVPKATKLEKQNKQVSANKPNLILEYFIKLVVFLSLIIGLLIFFMKVYKKHFYGKSHSELLKTKSYLKIINKLYINPKQQLLTVKIQDKLYVIASSEAGLNLITEITEKGDALREVEKKLTGTHFEESITKEENGADFVKNEATKKFVKKATDKISISEVAHKLKDKMKNINVMN